MFTAELSMSERMLSRNDNSSRRLFGWTFLFGWAWKALIFSIHSAFSSLNGSVRRFHFANFRQFCYETHSAGFIKPLRRQTNV
jgi:hypothetical protein